MNLEQIAEATVAKLGGIGDCVEEYAPIVELFILGALRKVRRETLIEVVPRICGSCASDYKPLREQAVDKSSHRWIHRPIKDGKHDKTVAWMCYAANVLDLLKDAPAEGSEARREVS